jgi:cytoskeleton protein RodZ
MRPEEEIGLLLKNRREELGLSIDHIVQDTKIRSKYLLAIEAGDFHVIPGEVYLRGFIKTYAKFIGLDGAALIEKLPAPEPDQAPVPGMSGSQPRPADAQSYQENIPSRRMRTGGGESGISLRTFLRIAKVLVLILALIFSLNYLYENVILRNLPDPIENGGNGDPGGGDNGNGSGEPQEPEPPALEINIISDSGTNALVEVNGSILELTIKASERCWLRVQTDDNPAESQTLQPGQEVSFTAESQILMRAGNSGGISIYLADELLEVSGRSGGVKNYTINLLP